MPVAFSDDHAVYAFCTASGFGTVAVDPFGDFGGSRCSLVSTSNLLILSGSGDESSFSPRKIRIVNSKRLKVVCELSFNNTVDFLKASGRRLAISADHDIYVYDLNTMKIEHSFPASQKYTLHCASSGIDYIAYSGFESPGALSIFDVNDKRQVCIITAHKSAVAIASFSNSGKLIATASEKGTLIRVFSCETGNMLFEFRRGTTPSKITSISFSPDDECIGCVGTSDTGHIFRLRHDTAADRHHTFMDVKNVMKGERDFAHLKLENGARPVFMVPKSYQTAYLQYRLENHVVVLKEDATLDLYSFNVNQGGKCEYVKSYTYTHHTDSHSRRLAGSASHRGLPK